MKQKELKQLKKGDFIIHKHFGLCVVDKLELYQNRWFGLIIRTLSVNGYITLANWSGVLFNRVFEDSKRLIISKVENPNIPKLIFETKTGFEVHKWKKLGQVSKNGKFSSIKLKEFTSQEETMSFALSN